MTTAPGLTFGLKVANSEKRLAKDIAADDAFYINDEDRTLNYARLELERWDAKRPIVA